MYNRDTELNIGECIRNARLARNISNSELAVKMKLSRQRIQALMTARHTNTQTIENLAKAFDMTINQF